MPSSLALSLPPMRPGQVLTYEKLRDEVRRAVRSDGRTRAEIARTVGISPGSLSDAENQVGSRYAGMQQRVLTALKPGYAFEDVGAYRVVRAQGRGEAE